MSNDESAMWRLQVEAAVESNQGAIAIDDVCRAIEALHARIRPRDLAISTAHLRVEDDDRVNRLVVHPTRGDGGTFHLDPLAIEQLWRLLGLDPGTMRRLPAAVRADGANRLLARSGVPVILRLGYGDRVRGILSRERSGVDDLPLARLFGRIVERFDGRLVQYEVADGRFRLRATFPGRSEALRRRDIVRTGLLLYNSDVGIHPAGVSELVERVLCGNLAVGAEQWRVRGEGLGALAGGLTQLHLRVTNLMRQQNRGAEGLERLRGIALPARARAAAALASAARLSTDARRALTATFVGASQRLASGEHEHLEASGFGLWNAATAAGKAQSGSAADQLMRAAGRLLQPTFQSRFVAAYEAPERKREEELAWAT